MDERKSGTNPSERSIDMIPNRNNRPFSDTCVKEMSSSSTNELNHKSVQTYPSSARSFIDTTRGNDAKIVLSAEETQLLPIDPFANSVYGKEKIGPPLRKETIRSVLVDSSSHTKNHTNKSFKSTNNSFSVEGIGTSGMNDIPTMKIEQSLRKASDSDNMVTAVTRSTIRNSSSSSECHNSNHSTTTTTSSGSGGDDEDRGTMGSINGNKNGTDNRLKCTSNFSLNEQSSETMLSTSDGDGLPPRKRVRHQQEVGYERGSWSYAKKIKKKSPKDNGSTLQVPGDDGSDRIVAGDIGGVPIQPATVVASRLFTPPSNGTENCLSSSLTLANGDKCRPSAETSEENQHHLLVLSHREPRYHTIRKTLYRFHSSDSNGNSNNFPNRSSQNNRNRRRHRGVEKKFSKTSKDDAKLNKASIRDHRHPYSGDRSNDSTSSANTQNGKPKEKGKKVNSKKSQAIVSSTNSESIKSKNPSLQFPNSSILHEGNVGGSSSGSGTDGTEDGYAGSVSSNENGSGNQQLGSSSPSPSETSSEECEQQRGRHKSKRRRRNNNSEQKSSRVSRNDGEDPELSSEIADFGSSGSSETMDEDDVGNERRGGKTQKFEIKEYTSSPPPSSPSLSSSNFSDSDGLELAYLSAKRDADAEHEQMLKRMARSKKSKKSLRCSVTKYLVAHAKTSRQLISKQFKDGQPPILSMGCDVMAHILTFLHPPEILDVLTTPLSKRWRRNFTSQPELWRVLCLVDPFKAIMNDPISPTLSKAEFDADNQAEVASLSDRTYYSVKTCKKTEKLLDKYRLLYTSFVRCMKYVSQIRDDAINGRPPAYIDYGISGAFGGSPDMVSVGNASTKNNGGSSSPPPPTTLGSNRNLQMFLAQARDVVLNSSNNGNPNNFGGETKADDSPRRLDIFPSLSTAARVGTAHRKNERAKKCEGNKRGPKFGRSMITSRLYGPVQGSEPSNLNLPWSCAIYSIVNWMVAFSDVEGLQTLCLKVLPVLLENEQHRLTAQHAGLADVVLRAMVMFSKSSQLHIAAFHTIVLLARPHGGREGMMFRTSMTADGIFRGIYQRHGKSGIAVMLDSMRRFQDNATLLAMSCWALVNIALVSDQKAVLVKLGGIQAITNAMYRHPFSAELQFRALFALINLVIPTVQNLDNNGNRNSYNRSDNNGERADAGAASIPSEPEQLGDLNETTEKEIIDELVGDIASLVVHVMKNFCSSEAILNRACLVLHNLSLTNEYHVILLWTPQCYQMLEWCVANFRSDKVLQQSATGTLHRLQSTLASDEQMRLRFSKSLLTKQQQNVTLKQDQHEDR